MTVSSKVALWVDKMVAYSVVEKGGKRVESWVAMMAEWMVA